MRTVHERRKRSRHGTVYVVMLAVLSIVMTISLSSLINARTELASASRNGEETAARAIARSALELAVDAVNADPLWREKVAGGLLVSTTSIAQGRVRVTVEDPIDGDLLDQYDDPFVLTAHAQVGQSRQKLSCRLDFSPTQRRSTAPTMALLPTSYWTLYDFSGNQCPDQRGVRDAVLQGSLVYDASDGTGVYRMPSLSSVNSTFYEISHDKSMELDYGSISFWMQPAATFSASSLTQVAVSKWDWDEAEATQIAVVCTNGFAFLILDYAKTMEYLNLGSITGDRWHHVAITWGGDGWNAYLDGDLAASLSTTMGLGQAWTTDANTEPWRIGAAEDIYRRFGMVSGMGNHFNGRICDFAIFAYELSAEDVKELAALAPQPVPLILDHQSITRVVD